MTATRMDRRCVALLVALMVALSFILYVVTGLRRATSGARSTSSRRPPLDNETSHVATRKTHPAGYHEVTHETEGTFQCRVFRSTDGLPLGDAHVSVFVGRAWRDFPADAQGLVMIPLPPANQREVVAWCDGYVPVRRELVASAVAPYPLALGAAGRISGAVVDEHGRPLARVVVAVFPRGRRRPPDGDWSPDWSSEPHGNQWARAITDSRGQYVMEGLAVPGAYRVCVIDAALFGTCDVSLLGPTATVDDLIARRRGTLYLSVRDPVGGELGPVQFSARRQSAATVEFPRAVPDQEGCVTYLWPGTYEIYVRPRRHPTIRRTVTIASGEITRLRVVAQDGSTISGVVHGPTHEPVAGAAVMFMDVDAAESGIELDSDTATTDDRGSFQIVGAAETPGTIYVWPGPDRYYPLARRDVRAGDGDLHLTLDGATILSGRVEGVTQGTEVTWLHGADPRCTGYVVRTESTGAFTTSTAEEPVPSQLVFLRPTYAPLLVHTAARRGCVIDIGSLRFERGRVVEGYVRNATGAAASGVDVSVLLPGCACAVARTSTDGCGVFKIANMPNSVVRLTFRADGHAATVTDVPPDLSRIDVQLRRGGTLRAAIYDAFGRPVPSAVIDLRRVDDDAGRVPRPVTVLRSSGLGECHASHVPPGRYVLEAFDAALGERVRGECFDVEDGVTSHVDYVFSAWTWTED